MSVLIPPHLHPGDTIAIIHTARVIRAVELEADIALAESWGLKVRLGVEIGRKHFQQAGTDAARATETYRPSAYRPELITSRTVDVDAAPVARTV